MMSDGRSRLPFTATQWEELEHQALIYKYMVCGMPVPPHLLCSIRTSSLDSNLLLHQPQHSGWKYLQMGFGKKIDPEPGRCRRTDGKKWRCSKEAYLDSKYCERHMHRGRNRSRKPVEVITSAAGLQTPPPIRFSSLTKTAAAAAANSCLSPSSPTTSLSFSYLTATPSSESHHHPFLYPHFSSSSSSTPLDHAPSFLLDSGAYSRNGSGHGMKEGVDEREFFSEASGSMRTTSAGASADWQVAPLTMASQSKHKNYVVSPQQMQDDKINGNLHMMKLLDSSSADQPKKVMHHFFDEWPQETKNPSCWLHDSQDKYSSHGQNFKTHLSISIPNSPHDFFMPHNEK